MSQPPRPVLLSWSGGKDAAWTLHTLRQCARVQVVGLLTTVNAEFDRVAMHGIRRDVLRAQARAAGLPLIEAVIPNPCSNEEYAAAMSAAMTEAARRWPTLRTVAFGDLLLEDVRAYRQANCARIGWEAITPLFGSDTAQLARQMQAAGLEAQLCCVDTQQLDARFAGRHFDAQLLDALDETVDRCGENGEFHTLVTAGPMFKQRVQVERGDTVLRDQRFAFTDFRLA